MSTTTWTNEEKYAGQEKKDWGGADVLWGDTIIDWGGTTPTQWTNEQQT